MASSSKTSRSPTSSPDALPDRLNADRGAALANSQRGQFPDADDDDRLLLTDDALLERSDPTLLAPLESWDAPLVASVDRSEPTF
jgi:hypothetical protein